jgi:hypothetical protein
LTCDFAEENRKRKMTARTKAIESVPRLRSRPFDVTQARAALNWFNAKGALIGCAFAVGGFFSEGIHEECLKVTLGPLIGEQPFAPGPPKVAGKRKSPRRLGLFLEFD